MSQENLEIIRRAYEDFNRCDFDALVNAWHPEVEWHQFTQFPDRGGYGGREELRDAAGPSQHVSQPEGS